MADIKLNFTGDKINELLTRMDNGETISSGIFELPITDTEYDNLLNNGDDVPLNSLNSIDLTPIKRVGVNVKIKNHIFSVFEFDNERLVLSNVFPSVDNKTEMNLQKLSLELNNGIMKGQFKKEKVVFTSIENVLVKDNTNEYHPTNDYEPATKKYVDDKINSSSGNNGATVSSNKLILGKYIIRFNDEKGTLDFTYTSEDIINVTFEAGAFNKATGQKEASSTAIRCSEPIALDHEFGYTITFEKAVNNMSYCLFDSSNNFIKNVSMGNLEKGTMVSIEIPENAAIMKFDFAAPSGSQEDAFKLIDYIDIGKSVSNVIEVEYEVGEFYDDGSEEPNTITIRNSGFIPIEQGFEYSISFPGEVRYFRYHFYDSAYNFLSRSESMDLLTAKTITLDNNDVNNAFMRFKFGAVDDDQAHAFEIAKQIVITKVAK